MDLIDYSRTCAILSRQPASLCNIRRELLKACEDLIFKREFTAPPETSQHYQTFQEMTARANRAIAEMKHWPLQEFAVIWDWNADKHDCSSENRAALNAEYQIQRAIGKMEQRRGDH